MAFFLLQPWEVKQCEIYYSKCSTLKLQSYINYYDVCAGCIFFHFVFLLLAFSSGTICYMLFQVITSIISGNQKFIEEKKNLFNY